MRIALAVSLLAVVSIGCDKSKEEPEGAAKVEAPDPAAKTPPTADKAPEKAPDKAPVAEAGADGWTAYDNAKYGMTVRVPAGVKAQEMNLDRSAEGVIGMGFQFELAADAIGQLMYLKYDGKEEYNIEEGLDGAVNGAVEAMGSKMLDYKKTTIGDRPAREFSFAGSAQGFSFEGSGIAIGSSGTEIKAAMSLYQKGSAASAPKAAKFVKSFEIK